MSTRKTSETPKAAKPRAPRKPRAPKTSVEASKEATQELAVRKATVVETDPEPKKGFTNDENGAPGVILKAFVLLILALFFYFGYIHHPKGDDGTFLWSAVHPTGIGDIIGTTLFTAAALAIGGFLSKSLAAAKWYPFAVGIAGVLGIILIFA